MSIVTTSDTATDKPTERRLSESYDIDLMSTREILACINTEDSKVPGAVAAILPQLATVVDHAVAAVQQGGRIHYFGAGTSGRFGVLDAAEVPPTYGVSADNFTAHLAGGAAAMVSAVEDAEDDVGSGAADAERVVRANDIAIGLAASGGTPYVTGALRRARELGALTVAITSNPHAPLADTADHHLCADTGPEVITGSTRMKAGTAQKLILSSFSTALMVRLGHTYSNLMIDLVPSNEKLRARVLTLLQVASGASAADAASALDTCGGEVGTALLVLLLDVDPARARALDQEHRTLREAVRHATRSNRQRAAQDCQVGVDIGASGYRVAIVRDGELVDMVQGRVRPAVTATGPDLQAVCDTVAREVAALTRRHSLDVATLGVGIAGGRSFPSVTDALLPMLNMVHVDMIAVFADGLSSYVGALGFEAGAVLAAGTGSVVIATDATATWRHTDGLGHLLGDIGSGAWIGRRALEVAVRHATGRPTTSAALRTAAENRFGSVATLVNDLYRSPDPSAMMASFVPDVVAAAPEDEVAAGLLAQAADELAATLLHAADGLTRRLAAVGRIAGEGGPLRHLLEQRLDAGGHGLTEAAGSAAEGAAHIVRALSQDTLPEVFRDQLLAVHA